MDNLIVNSSPHLKSGRTTRNIMLDVLIALIPATVFSIYLFSYTAALIIASTTISALLFELLLNRILKQKTTIGDFSAVVSGLILALNLPPTVDSIWMGVVGSFVAIVLIKMIFGGIGQNIFNPAMAARVFLTVSFASQMTTWISPGVDGVSSATALALAGNGVYTNYMDLFLGNIPGSLGETSALAILLGLAWLLLRKVISIDIPLVYLLTVAGFAFLVGEDPLFHVLAGGVLFGAVFMATDYATSPITRKGKIIFGFGLGIITMGIRLYGSLPEGTSFAILFMNILVPLIDRYTKPRAFGIKKVKNG